jgi:uncharacterized protein (TIGR02453 family)
MSGMSFDGFQPTVFQFLKQLRRNNNRPWFQENKRRYEAEVLAPSLAFIEAFRPRLKKISPCFLANSSRVGGSLMRIYRDIRFSKDKLPYKTNVGIQFRHEMGKDVHAPGFYVHIEPGMCFLGAGIWHPDGAALAKIREAIDSEPKKWKRARDDKRFRARFQLGGESLKSSPRDYDRNHPLIEDLRRKDFIGGANLNDDDVLAGGFLDNVSNSFAASRPFVRFLCEALALPF